MTWVFTGYEAFFLGTFALGFALCVGSLVREVAGPRPEDDR